MEQQKTCLHSDIKVAEQSDQKLSRRK